MSIFSNIGDKLRDLIKTVTVIGIISAIFICLIYEDLIYSRFTDGNSNRVGFMNRLFRIARIMLCFIHNRNKVRGAVKPLLYNLFAKYVSADCCDNRS